MIRNCTQCLHQEICVFLRGEMLMRDYWGRDFIKELERLKIELAGGCGSYYSDPKYLKEKESP